MAKSKQFVASTQCNVSPIQRNLQRLALESSSTTSSGDESQSSNSTSGYQRRRKNLGKFSEKIYREKLARGERIFGQPITMDPCIKQCGWYKENTIIKDVQIIDFRGSHEFHFSKRILTPEQLEVMRATPSIMTNTGQQAHLANPYHANIGQFKLYYQEESISRCQILDLFCQPSRGRLKLFASIHLYDENTKLQCVDYSLIYDYPHNIQYIKDVEPETKAARLNIDKEDTERQDEVEKFFALLMQGHVNGDRYDIKIMDYKDNKYFVDLIGSHDQSAIDLITKKFGNMRPTYGRDSPDYVKPQLSPVCYPVSSMFQPKVFPELKRGAGSKTNPRGGALSFLKSLLKSNEASNFSYTKKRFFQVKVVDWMDPNHLTVQPAHKDYVQNFGRFVNAIQSLKCVQQANKSDYRRDDPFRVGEHVLFKNTSCDQELGQWMRGVVVSTSCYNDHGMAIHHITDDHLQDYKVLVDLVERKMIIADDLLYLVRSVDFGYHSRSSQANMRHLKDLKEFKTLGTWALRCRLFGINHSPSDVINEWAVQQYSSSCRDVMDGWVRNRILDRGRIASFHVLFRTDIESRSVENSYDYQFDVTLFHRSVPSELPFMPILHRTRFDCLNWHLVDCGLASDGCRHDPDESSQIQLDYYIVNKLVSQNMI